MFNTHNCGKAVCFNLVHDDYPFVTLRASSELKMPGPNWVLQDEQTLPWKEACNDFMVLVREDVDDGILSVFDGKSEDPADLLLCFSLKKVNHGCSHVKILELGKNLKAIVYRPAMEWGWILS